MDKKIILAGLLVVMLFVGVNVAEDLPSDLSSSDLSSSDLSSVVSPEVYALFEESGIKTWTNPRIITCLKYQNGRLVPSRSFAKGEDVWIMGIGFFPTKEKMKVYVFSNRNWTKNDPLNRMSPGYKSHINVRSHRRYGIIYPKIIWDPDDSGQYDIIVDVNKNGKYDPGKDLIKRKSINKWAFEVVPELSTIALMGAGLLSMIGFVGIKKTPPGLNNR